MKRKTLLRIILTPFLLHWSWLFYHYLLAMRYMQWLGWGNVQTAPPAYLIVQSWMLLSEIMVMLILVALVYTFDKDLI